MARYRTVKPELFTDEKLADVPIEARFLFIGLLPHLDDMGRRRYSPTRIKFEVFPGDEKISPAKVDGWVHDLQRVDVLRIYEVENRKYLWLPQFLRHQKIDRPGHSDNPPHPTDPDPDCKCFNCKHERNGNSVPAGTHRVLVEDSSNSRRVLDESSIRNVGSVGSKNSIDSTVDKNTYIQGKDAFFPHSQESETNAENRRAEIAALDKITRAILALLELEPNSNYIRELSEAIRLKARWKSCSIEAAAQQISGKAAFLNAGSPPEDWSLWFADVRYDYVPQGDARLNGRNVSARPTCGGSLCTDGWEIVNVQGEPRLRRCPDCAKLW